MRIIAYHMLYTSHVVAQAQLAINMLWSDSNANVATAL